MSVKLLWVFFIIIIITHSTVTFNSSRSCNIISKCSLYRHTKLARNRSVNVRTHSNFFVVVWLVGWLAGRGLFVWGFFCFCFFFFCLFVCLFVCFLFLCGLVCLFVVVC